MDETTYLLAETKIEAETFVARGDDMTYAELQAQHPTPWKAFCFPNGQGQSYIVDANGDEVKLKAVVAMMNEAAKEIAKSRGAVEAVIEITGHSPECVDVRRLQPETVVKCVEAIRNVGKLHPDCDCNFCQAFFYRQGAEKTTCESLSAAVAALEEEGAGGC